MEKKSFILSFVLMTVAILPNSASAIFVHDSTNTIDRVVAYCTTKGPTEIPVYKAPETEYLGTTGFWSPWAGTVGPCIVYLYKRIEKDGETQFKEVCKRSLIAYESLEHLGYGENTRCYLSRSPRP